MIEPNPEPHSALNPARSTDTEPDLERFWVRLDAAMAAGAGTPFRLVLSKPRAAGSDLRRVAMRRVTLRGETGFSLVYSHATRDLTLNLSHASALQRVRDLLGQTFQHAHLRSADAEIALLVSRKGRASLREQRLGTAPAPAPAQRPHPHWRRLPKRPRTTAPSSAGSISAGRSLPRSASPMRSTGWCRRWRASGSRSTSSSRSSTTPSRLLN